MWERIKSIFPGEQVTKREAPRDLFNYRRAWRFVVFLTGGVALVPLIVITLIDYEVTQTAIESEFLLRATWSVSNTKRAIAYFLTERKAALEFIVRDNSFEMLSNPSRLDSILANLRTSFGGGFTDLSVIDSSGLQRNYVGPYELEGKNYGDQDWYKQVVESGVHISDVFLGYRQVPHTVVAVKRLQADGTFFVLRASIGIAPFQDLLSNLEFGGMADAFMINQKGTLQTPSRYYGKVLGTYPLEVPAYSSDARVFETKNIDRRDVVVGYGFIEGTPFILMIVKDKNELMKPWFKTRLQLIAFLLVSMTVITSVILATATYMVQKVRVADERRLMTLHQVEYSNKMASIGRLAANVAHEINNPLAIINEKAGLIKDLFTLRKEYASDERLENLVDVILRSIKRAATITKRLLTFARNLETHVEPVDLRATIEEVLSFREKEAQHRGIAVTVDVPGEITEFLSDRGKLQQIFVNIVDNAFAAMENDGHLNVEVARHGKDTISITFADDGCGIAQDELDRVFEPFFSTKTGHGGTGLGLSITYNLVQELGGRITVDSELGDGTRFTIILPLVQQRKEG